MKTNAISSGQLVTLLFLSRIFNIFTYTPHSQTSVPGSVVLLAIPLAGIIMVALFFPAWHLIQKSKMGILEAAQTVHPFFGNLCAGIIGMVCLLMGAYTVSHFEFFMISTIYPQAESWIFVLLFLPVVAYAAYLGIEAVARMSVTVFIVVLGIILLVLVGLLPEINLVYVQSPFIGGWKMIVIGCIRQITNNMEILLFLLLVPTIRGNGKKAYIIWIILGAAMYEILSFFTLTSLGEYSATRLFPFYTAASVAKLSIFGRLDLLHIAVWVFVAFIRTTLYVYGAYLSFRILFPKVKKGWGIFLCAFLMTGVSMLNSLDMRYLSVYSRVLFNGVPFILVILLIPILTLLLGRKKWREKA
ncbi:spore germination protein [Youxingia wuxianensis]|uniref:GerAB/ArcD/ProY family transporter n=1 Tax=Youxingia wuxianensis TaxID=2763678 RepID=A0A926IC04_9FIRM|nr:spore germination protein [Youxingia wuxianensis]MBC8584682.1 GerAB/ArcD/ProY family transporter [Youxingia wuxianensis]